LTPEQRLAPQMAEYAKFGADPHWRPYLMYFSPAY
jgi:hypothetical protein